MSHPSKPPKTPSSKTPARAPTTRTPKTPTHVPDGASFLIRLDPLECTKKILIPGHRFEPFHPNRISIPHLEIHLPNTSLLPKKNIVLPYNEILRFHNLMNLMDMFYLLEEMHPDNIPSDLDQAAQTFDRLMRLTVFDLEPLFPTPIQQGSYLRISVQHYQKGIFTAAPLTPEEASHLDRETWFSAMDTAFTKAFDELKFPRRNDTLLSLVYRYGGQALYANPAAALIDYLDAKRAAEIIYFGGENLIWKKGADPKHIVLEDLDAYGTGSRKPRKTTRKGSLKTRLDRFFDNYEFAFTADEIKALMLDMAYRGTTLQNLWDRFFEYSPQWTVFPEAADELIDLLEHYCDEALANYDPHYDTFGHMRATLVDIYADYIAWLRHLDTKLRSPQDIPIEPFTQLANLISSINEFMLTMNNPTPTHPLPPPQPDQLEQFFQTTHTIRQAITDLQHEIEKSL